MANSYGYNDMMRMQSEAVQRVQEMQRRAQNAVQRANAQRADRAQEKSESKGDSPRRSTPPISASHARATALPLDYLSPKQPISSDPEPTPSASAEPNQKPDQALRASPPIDTDRLLVVVLILLLSQEEADELLLMALGYLIM